jgi:hypothetical protein
LKLPKALVRTCNDLVPVFGCTEAQSNLKDHRNLSPPVSDIAVLGCRGLPLSLPMSALLPKNCMLRNRRSRVAITLARRFGLVCFCGLFVGPAQADSSCRRISRSQRQTPVNVPRLVRISVYAQALELVCCERVHYHVHYLNTLLLPCHRESIPGQLSISTCDARQSFLRALSGVSAPYVNVPYLTSLFSCTPLRSTNGSDPQHIICRRKLHNMANPRC